MNEIPLKQVIDASVENLKKAMSTDTVVGEPITLPDSTVIIPISKVSVGFTSGGVDFDSKNNPKKETPHFGGGNGAGMSVVPVAFLVCSKGEVKILGLPEKGAAGVVVENNIVDSITQLLEKSPSIIEKIKGIFKKEDSAKEAPVEEETEPAEAETK